MDRDILAAALDEPTEGAAFVECGRLNEATSLSYCVRPHMPDLDLLRWAEDHVGFIRSQLTNNGAILFRGFQPPSVEAFESFISLVGGEALPYGYRSTPREQVHNNIYTSTYYPKDQFIPLHNEMAYSTFWPMILALCCFVAPDTRGETPLADSRRILARLDPALVETFRQKRVMYVRNFRPGLDLPWQVVMQTESREEMAAFCDAQNIAYEWLSHDHLRIRQVCQAVATHPVTGEEVWFNQAHLFHPSGLRPEVRALLASQFTEDELPRNARYGDGEAIPEEALAQIHAAFAAEKVSFPWQVGDVALVDNMLAAHAREPFTGERRVLVGMTGLHQGERYATPLL